MPAEHAPETVAVVCVYRHRNASTVRQILDQVSGAEIRLWALDELAEDLAAQTVGRGPGDRITLLKGLVASLSSSPEMLVLVDDDVCFAAGDLRRLLRAGKALGFDLFQPAHTARSAASHPLTRLRPTLFARESTFVEEGPLTVLARRAQAALLPFPDEFGMGWGIDVRWTRVAVQHRLRLGIIDAVSIRHDAGVGLEYDTGPEFDRLRAELAVVGATHISEVQHEVRRIRPLEAWRVMHRGAHPSVPVAVPVTDAWLAPASDARLTRTDRPPARRVEGSRVR